MTGEASHGWRFAGCFRSPRWRTTDATRFGPRHSTGPYPAGGGCRKACGLGPLIGGSVSAGAATLDLRQNSADGGVRLTAATSAASPVPGAAAVRSVWAVRAILAQNLSEKGMMEQ
jgi:hypothetical protein